MTDLKEIILTIKKVEDKDQKNNEIKQRKKNYTNEEELKDWIINLKEKLYKCNYKRVMKDIVSASLMSKFKKVKGGYKIVILYIQAKLKIIEKKIFKYHLNQNDNIKQKYQISHCFSYANNIQNELNSLLQEISDNNLYDNKYYYDINKRNYKIELFDDIIRCHFDYIYTMSLLHYKIGNFMECISYLSLFLTLYKETKPYILSTHTLYKIEKCFIILSKIYISNEDFDHALIFLNEAINVSFKQILFQVHELYFGVFVGEKKDLIIRERDDLLVLRDSRIKRIIFNIVIIFFYQGICNEHLSNIKNAIAFYKQSEWFGRIFLAKDYYTFYKLFLKIKNSAIEAGNNILFINEKIQEYEMKQWIKKREENNNEINNKKSKTKKDKIYDTTKFKGLIQKLEALKIQEIDTVNKFDKNKNIKYSNSKKREGEDKNLFLSNIRLLEAYLRNDFKNIVSDMDKINLFDLDYRTRTIVQKSLNKIYFEQNQKPIGDENKNILYKKYKKNLTFKNKRKIKYRENNNIANSKNNSNSCENKVFDLGLYLKKKYNKKKNLNLSNVKFSKSNSLNQISVRKEQKENENNYNNKNKFFLRNRDTIDSSRMQKIDNTASSSIIFNYSHQPNNIKNTLSKSKSLFLKNEKEKESEKNKSSLLTKICKSSKYKLIHPENQKLNEFFNIKYLKKREYIKKLCDRELLFQKSILKSKNTPRLSFQIFNKPLVEQSANNSFIKIESLVSNRIGNNDWNWKDIFTEEEFKEYLLNNRLEKILLSSLDNRALINYKMNKKKKEKKEEEKEILEDNAKYEKKFGNINKNNKNILNELNQKLNIIYENELKRKTQVIKRAKEINKQIIKKFYRNKSALNGLNIKDNLNEI